MIALASKPAIAHSSAADEVFQSKPWNYEFKSDPFDDSYTNRKKKKTTESRSRYRLADDYDDSDAEDPHDHSNSSYLSNTSFSSAFVAATDTNYSFDGNIGGYFELALAIGGSSNQGRGSKIQEALYEIGGTPITFGIHFAYLHSISGDQKLHLGAGLLLVGSSAERETPNYKEEFTYSDYILGLEAKYCLNYDPAFGSYLRAGAGISGKSWGQKRSNEWVNASRSDGSEKGWGSFLALGYAGSLYDTHWPLYAEMMTAFTNAEGPAHLGTLPSTHFLLTVGMQFH